MNWEQLERKCKELKRTLKQQWTKLTDQDLDYIAGNRDRFLGKLQERYGLSKEECERKVDEWLSAQHEIRHEQHSSAKR